MKKIITCACLLLSMTLRAQHGEHKASTLGYADSVNAGLIKEDKMKGSPTRMAMANVGASHVHITYGSPGVKGRNIWGGLVSYDVVWCAGAHNATWISFSEDVTVNGKPLKAGKYGFFIIPKASGPWTIIFNSDAEMHLADEYDQAKDALRLDVQPLADALESLPRLTFSVKEDSKGMGHILFAWDKKRIKLDVRSVK
jgi:hypothetical protein